MRALEACNGAFSLVFLHGSTEPVQRLDNPSDRPIGDPGMVHLPLDTQKCAICQTSATNPKFLLFLSIVAITTVPGLFYLIFSRLFCFTFMLGLIIFFMRLKFINQFY